MERKIAIIPIFGSPIVCMLETLVFIVGQRLTACTMVSASASIPHEVCIGVQVLFHLVPEGYVLV
jgi:hypothetical protein